MSQIKVNDDSVPVTTWGLNADFAKKIRKLLAPRYDVVHACTTHDAAMEELPLLFSGDKAVRPSNGIGSNVELSPEQENRISRILIFGGGVTPELKEDFRSAIKKHGQGAAWVEEVVYVSVDREKMLKRLNGAPPQPEVSASLAIEALEELGIGK